jgi:IstB-like ATP binding protein
VSAWHELIGDAAIADAILDRIIHNPHHVTLEGDSMRKQKTATPLTPVETPKSSANDSNKTLENQTMKTVRDLPEPLSAN